MKDIIELIRSIVRPLSTIIFVGGSAAVVFWKIDAPAEWWTLTGVVVAFWFATRPQEKNHDR